MRVSFSSVLSLALLQTQVTLTSSQPLIISEIASKGTRNDAGICQYGTGIAGQDWVELHNVGNESVDLSTMVLHDDKGIQHENAFTFATLELAPVMAPGDYLVICPAFGIGGADTVTLTSVIDTDTTASSVISSISLTPGANAFDVTYAWDSTTNLYSYTSTPTPNEANKFSPPQQAAERWKAQLEAQNDLGSKFFNMDRNGYPVKDAMDTLLDLHLTMDDMDYQYTLQNASHEVYRPFKSASLYHLNTTAEPLWTMDTPRGRIRPKGQSSLFFGVCAGAPDIPFQLDFGDDSNSSSGLYGVKKLYLRNHFGDLSYARDWSYNRMAARFGLPHLRARQVRVVVNGNLHGMYTLLEAVDQEYVFARSFPAYNPNSYALYKVKTVRLFLYVLSHVM